MSGEPVEYRVADRVAWVRLNRPEKRNAINGAVRDGLAAAFAAVEADDEVGLVVLTGAPPMFCAGVDLTETAGQPEPGPVDLGTPVCAPLDACTRPVLAAVNGPALGGGFELALAADLRVASRSATFSLPELRIGSLPGSGGTQRLFGALPAAVAWRVLATGERLGAAEAARLGLVSDVYDDEVFEDGVRKLAESVAAAAPLSLRAAKLAVRQRQGAAAGAGMAVERLLWRVLAGTQDRAEGRAAFAEKRPPRFEGR